jgi:hypothetical protein
VMYSWSLGFDAHMLFSPHDKLPISLTTGASISVAGTILAWDGAYSFSPRN